MKKIVCVIGAMIITAGTFGVLILAGCEEQTAEAFKPIVSDTVVEPVTVTVAVPVTVEETEIVNEDPMEQLLDAIAIVESNCNPRAIGDNGKAHGMYQIWMTYLNDVNRFAGTHYVDADRMDPVASRNMVRLYLEYYGRRYTRLTGKPATMEVLARIHNGGPNGYRKAATLKYWQKVQRELNK